MFNSFCKWHILVKRWISGITTVTQKGQSQVIFPKHKSVYQNTNQSFQNTNLFTKTRKNFLKHKSVYQTHKKFPKTQINLPKHKTISHNTNQFPKTQIKILGTCSVTQRETGRNLFPGYSASIRRFLFCCRRFHENVLPQLWI